MSMSHEIYYTSAPEGVKRGTSGFCTVAASENIPKALWDRLYDEPGFGIWLGNFREIFTDEKANAEFSEYIANRIRRRVKDPAVAEKLIPRDHGFGVQRVPMETRYFEAYNRPNVHLVDIGETPLVRVTETGLRTTEREGVMSIPVVGDAMARPLIDEIERGDYDLSGLAAINNGGAPITPGVRHRIHEALPNILILDAVGSSETGIQMNHYSAAGAEAETAVFNPEPDTGVVDDLRTRVLQPGDGGGWLARRGLVPLGYLGDAAKTAQTFPVIDGVRWSVPGDRAELLDDGRIRLLGRDSVTINSGGEKIFAEEVERALAAHPDVADVVVAGRPSERWGSEVVAIVALRAGSAASDDDLLAEAGRHVARYKLPKAIVRRSAIARSPSGKADYRWARAQAETG